MEKEDLELFNAAVAMTAFLEAHKEEIDKVQTMFPQNLAVLLYTFLESGLDRAMCAVEMFKDYDPEDDE